LLAQRGEEDVNASEKVDFSFNLVQCQNAQILNKAQMYGSFGIWKELASSLLFREKLLKKCYDTYLLLDEEQFGYFEAEKVDRDSQLRFKYDVP